MKGTSLLGLMLLTSGMACAQGHRTVVLGAGERRLIVQRIDADRRADPSSPTSAFEFKTTVGSLVYSHRQSMANILYLGVSRSRERAGSPATATEIFAKLQFGV